VLNSGILGDPRDGATFDYEPASAARLEQARHIGAVCERHGVSLPVAATAFPLRHPAVACVLVGARSPDEVAADVEATQRAIPDALWADLVSAGLLPETA
ncbi:MAG TPA: aldo/keto reductase, partial [Solirubrobacteraceae bacterium]|nr:aldo/keto reductase [Solirubrobacteraceae bacterium]